MSQQFDVSEEKRKVLLENAKRREFLRGEFLKQTSNPFRHATGEGGTVFDPAIQRYIAMKVNNYDYFKPNLKTSLYGLCLIVIPMFSYGYLVHRSRTEQEAKYRRGEVAYKDRNFKFV